MEHAALTGQLSSTHLVQRVRPQPRLVLPESAQAVAHHCPDQRPAEPATQHDVMSQSIDVLALQNACVKIAGISFHGKHNTYAYNAEYYHLHELVESYVAKILPLLISS